MKAVCVDTGYLFALEIANDQHHQAATQHWQGTVAALPNKRVEQTAHPTCFLGHGYDQGREASMEQVKIFHDRTGNTLTVWFGNPQEEYWCEETGEEVILMKDRTGRVIGFEKLNFSVSTPDQLRISFETVSM